MIPKIIHYCWFGGGQMPQKDQKCLESWSKYCPDYTIMRWDESNYDVTKNPYMADAYSNMKWGFVPDYARFDIIYQYGGIYLDTDVELLKPLDALLQETAFMGCEDVFFVSPGLGFGAEQGNEMIKQLRDLYDSLSFIKENGELNLVPSPRYVTEYLCKCGLTGNNKFQTLNGMSVYPSDYFSPMNYSTGLVELTANTYSIHHFSASWVSGEEKQKINISRKISRMFGKKLGILISAVSGKVLRFCIIICRFLNYAEKYMRLTYVHIFYRKARQSKQIIIFDTRIGSDNLGDEIINHYCDKVMEELELHPVARVATHIPLSKQEKKLLRADSLKIITGTNLLCSCMNANNNWKKPRNVRIINHLCLLGTGWENPCDKENRYTKLFYRTLLDQKVLHSVRDSFTEQKLQSLGITNVINTGCPSTWGLTPEVCNNIPTKKGTYVVTTVTDYCRDCAADWFMLDTLLELYDTVFVWEQGVQDGNYLKMYRQYKKLVCIPHNLADYERILDKKDMDYVGTRLHAGIHALNRGHRSLIIVIDNRAREMGKDIHLPTLERKQLRKELALRIQSDYKTEIVLPTEAIQRWKAQFSSNRKGR